MWVFPVHPALATYLAPYDGVDGCVAQNVVRGPVETLGDNDGNNNGICETGELCIPRFIGAVDEPGSLPPQRF